jgi:hypothetical protein
MSRLIKAIGDIKSSDVDFKISDSKIVIYLTNKDKLKEMKEWKYFKTSEENDLGFISYQKKEVLLDDTKKYEIYVSYLEVNKAYKDSMIVMFLLDKFMELELNPAIQKYGEENIMIKANFANAKLNQKLTKALNKRNIALNYKLKGEPIKWDSRGDSEGDDWEPSPDQIYDMSQLTQTQLDAFEYLEIYDYCDIYINDDFSNHYFYCEATIPNNLLSPYNNISCIYSAGEEELFAKDIDTAKKWVETNGNCFMYVSKSGQIKTMNKSAYDEFNLEQRTASRLKNSILSTKK